MLIRQERVPIVPQEESTLEWEIIVTKIVSPESMQKAIVNAFPRYKELNLRAFEEGMKLGQEALEQQPKTERKTNVDTKR